MTMLKENKSPKGNGVRSKLLKWGGDTLNSHLLKVFNDFWIGTSPLPRAWVDVIVVTIYKRKGPKSDQENYRSVHV